MPTPDIVAFFRLLAGAAPKFWLGVTVGSGFILVAPDSWAEALRLSSFRYEYGPFVGAAFVLGTGLFAAHVLFAEWTGLRRAFKMWSTNRLFLKKWKRLTDEEKTPLAYCMELHRFAFAAQPGDPAVQTLVDLGLVEFKIRRRGESAQFKVSWDFREAMERNRTLIRRHLDGRGENEAIMQMLVQIGKAEQERW